MKYALGWVNETEPERDDEGNVIEGSERPVFVLLDLPPGLDEAGKRNRDSIERACRKAVYEKGMEEYGNKKLVVISYGEYFDVAFERTTVTRLLPPDKAEKVRSQNGKGAVVVTEEPEEPESTDGDDAGDEDSED